MLATRAAPAACLLGGRPTTGAASRLQRPAPPWHGSNSFGSQRPAQPRHGSNSFGSQRRSSALRLKRPLAAVDASSAGEAAATNTTTAASSTELLLWRFLQQQGFSSACVGRLQAAHRSGKLKKSIRSGNRLTEARLQRELAPNIAALRAEGLDTASIEQLFERFPVLITTQHTTFSSSLAALQQLAALLPDDPRAVQAPPGATQLGVALWLYPTTSAYLLTRASLASVIGGNLRLRQQLGFSDAEAAVAIMRTPLTLVSNFERGEAMVAHLQGLQASGALTVEQVTRIALSNALNLTPVEFDRRWQELGLGQANLSAIEQMKLKDPAGRQRAAVQALGELLQAAEGVPGPLQQQYRQQAEALVARSRPLWIAGPAQLRASWASLQQLGMSGSQVVDVVQKQAAILTHDWQGAAKQRLLAWVQQELGLSSCDFLTRYAGYSTYSTATLAMRADFLQQHRPAVWEATLSRGAGPLLSLLTHRSFLFRAGVTAAELADFNLAWLATPAGRRWGSKARRVQRRSVEFN